MGKGAIRVIDPFKVIEKYGGQCSRCGFSDIRALQIDHVNGGGCQEIKRHTLSGYYKKVMDNKNGKYQLLCANCNWIKRYENGECRKENNDNNTPSDNRRG